MCEPFFDSGTIKLFVSDYYLGQQLPVSVTAILSDRDLFLLNSFQAVRVFVWCAEIFPLAQQRINFLQKELGSKNICTNFGDLKRDIQRVKITQILSQSSLELRAIHSGYYSGANHTSRSI
jgi:hypothetical protein